LAALAQNTKAFQLASRGIKIDPVRVAKAVATRDANGQLAWKRTGPWIAYEKGVNIALDTTVAYDSYEWVDTTNADLTPGNNPSYTANCDTFLAPGSRWFQGPTWVSGYRYDDLKVVAGAAGKLSTRSGFAWFMAANSTDFSYFVTTTENFADDVNGLNPNDPLAATGRGDYPGIVANFGTVAVGGYYNSDVDLTTSGLSWQMPADANGGLISVGGDYDEVNNVITLNSQGMLWGRNAGNPTPLPNKLIWDDDTPFNLVFEPAELYDYTFGLCPDPLGQMFCFFYTPGSTTETLAPVSEQIGLGTPGSGGNLASWAANDGNNRKICKFFVPFPSSPFIRVNLNYTTTKPAPTAISFDVKVAVDPGGIQQMTLKMQNKVSNAFVNTSVVSAPTASGTTYNGVPSGTLADYVGGGGAMTGQIEVLAVGFQTSSFPCLEFDSGLMVVTG